MTRLDNCKYRSGSYQLSFICRFKFGDATHIIRRKGSILLFGDLNYVDTAIALECEFVLIETG